MRLEAHSKSEFTLLLGEVFDFKTVEPFRRCYEQINREAVRTINVDFASTRYMDSSALGMLLNLQDYFKQPKANIIIKNTNDQIRKILMISRFDQKFTIQ